MVQFNPVLVACIIGFFAGSTAAHPGHDHTQEAAERAAFMKTAPRGLEHCTEKLKARGLDKKIMARREALATSLREKRNLAHKPFLKARDTEDVLNTDHHSNLTGIDLDTDPSKYFGDNTACILQPNVTEGPYWIDGELIRSDVTAGEEGVALTVDIQFIDISTCEPLTDVYTDFWHSNATGVYSGIIGAANGDPNDETNIDNPAYRGVQKTDEEGMVRFDSIVPGHYAGRTPHIHILTHSGGELLPNNTFSGLTASHIGQLYFDQSLISEVTALEPYASNTQPLTPNSEDFIFAQEADFVDPVFNYVYLGESVSDGLLGWATVGIDPTKKLEPNPSAHWTEDGGVDNPDGPVFPPEFPPEY
ncbi:hypothetical protein FQN54_001770 [Arachnomyces sp. PD_36]|nr:hypothetical protein FQN54_001770 [Arachnomyces sp. PD_36]